MADLKTGAGNIQDEPGVPCSARKHSAQNKMENKNGAMSKGYRSQMTALPVVKMETI